MVQSENTGKSGHMGQSELLGFLCQYLDQIGVRYFITGSHATIAYGEPRYTMDIDVVVDLTLANWELFCSGFPEKDFYLSKQAAREAVVQCGMFNVIHPESGLKIDVIVPKQSPFDRLRLQRGVRLPLATGGMGTFSSAEDIIVQKMQWHKMGGGDRHLSDIGGVLKIRGDAVDRSYIAEQVKRLGLQDIWRQILGEID